MSFKVLVSSSFPEALNRNLGVRDHMIDGFRALLGEENVILSTFSLLETFIERHRPDFVLAIGSCVPSVCDYRRLSITCRKLGAQLGFWMVDDPYEFDFHYKLLNVADIIFTNDSWAREFYQHDNVHHLPLAASRDTHWRPLTPRRQRPWDIFFCGVSFPNREMCIADLAPVLRRYSTGVFGADWRLNEPFIENKRIPNAKLPDCYAGSAFVLNMGRNLNLANRHCELVPSTPGPRTFEAAMAGTVQIFYYDTLEIEDYFKIGKEILVFESPADFAALIERYHDDLDAWKSIAEAAQHRALADHCYENRAARVLNILGVEHMQQHKTVSIS